MKRGVSIMFINGLVVAVVLLFSFGVDVTNRLVHQRYDQTVSSQRALIACNNASKVFQQQSDELTLRVNNYVETDSTDALFAYLRSSTINLASMRSRLPSNMMWTAQRSNRRWRYPTRWPNGRFMRLR